MLRLQVNAPFVYWELEFFLFVGIGIPQDFYSLGVGNPFK